MGGVMVVAFYLSVCFRIVSLGVGGQLKVEPHTDWTCLGVHSI